MFILCDFSIGSRSIQILDTYIDTADHNSADEDGLMDSEDLRYDFHDNFSPVGLTAGDAAAYSEIDDSIALVESLPDTLNTFIDDVDAFAVEKKATWRRNMTILKSVPPVLTTSLIRNDEKLNQSSQLVV